MTLQRSLTDWLAWLEQQHPKAIDLGLDRVGEVADRLGVRQPGCPVITVGGTNGKGSTVATLVSIYRAAGLRVGSYTSPHLLRFNERVCISGTPVDDATLVAAFEEVDRARAEVSLTYFEFTTLAAFLNSVAQLGPRAYRTGVLLSIDSALTAVQNKEWGWAELYPERSQLVTSPYSILVAGWQNFGGRQQRHEDMGVGYRERPATEPI